MEDISLERWKEAFAAVSAIAIEKGYFDDILFFDLFPITEKEDKNIADLSISEEETYNKVFKPRWEKVDEAFLKVFGYNRDIFY